MFDPAAPLSDEFRAAVARAVSDFLAGQRQVLAGIGDGAAPLADLAEAFTGGGKRVRPAFCAWGWIAAAGYPDDPESLVRAAGSLDVLHVSALVHDDVMDASDTRRGQPAAHRQFAALHTARGLRGDAEAFGRGGAILLGDLLLVWSQEMFRGSGLPPEAIARAMPVMESVLTEVTTGQFLDILAQARPALDARTDPGQVMAQVRQVLEYKTARYTVVRPLQIGAALAGATPATQAALAGYGSAVGRAFQLRDDILGVFGDPALTGKPAGDDVREGKLTALLAHALRAAGESDARELAGLAGRSDLTDAEIGRARAIITGTGALAAVEQELADATAEALAGLTSAPVTEPARVALANLALAAADRSA
ncbi:MAG: polyprenyl synthetase family protein [Propionicimonas sp.]